MPENYTPLSLKYRPQKFSDLVGQELASEVLKNIIRRKEIYPGFIFYGSWGCGKTSSARILAKALNCPHVKDGEPCDICESCISITNGVSLTVKEIDGASYGNVDNIRRIGEEVTYKPSGLYRVIVMDECHMVTTAGWNAMLKVLEEPPDNTVFIFVTTNEAKIPDTIVSRCFSVPFRFVTQAALTERLKLICSKENIKYEPETLESIVDKTQGAVRDAVVLLDQARMLMQDNITKAGMEKLGFCRKDVVIKFIQCWIREGNVPGAIEVYREWSPLVGPEEFLRAVERQLREELFGYLKIGQNSVLKLTLKEIWHGIEIVWKAIDLSREDWSRAEIFISYAMHQNASQPLGVGPAPSTPTEAKGTTPNSFMGEKLVQSAADAQSIFDEE